VNRAEQVIEHTLNGYLDTIRRQQETTRMDPISSIEADARRAASRIASQFHHGDVQQQLRPSFSPATAATRESTMANEFAEIGHLLTVVDKETIHAINVILAHPEGIGVVSTLATAAGLPLPPGGLTALLTAADLVANLFIQKPAQQAAPAQPQQQASGTGSQPAMAPRVI
jgi:hypothetical protein